MTRESYIYAAVRTPFGRFGGALRDIRPDDLAARTLIALAERTSRLDPATVDEVVWGCANQAGEDNRNVGRMALLLAGWPTSVPATTVNRLCGSSLDAAMAASRSIDTGDARLVVAGGVESMTRAPWVLAKPSRAFPATNADLVSTTLGWRLINPEMPSDWTLSLGECNELLAVKYGVSRKRQDEFAAHSHQRAAQAWDSGFYDDLVVPLEQLTRDEGIRGEATSDTLGALRPSFRADGTITAGNASPLSDGAAAVLLGSGDVDLGTAPLARIAGRGTVANDPRDFGYAPVAAANLALQRAGIRWDQVGPVELNEAFSVQALVCIDAWLADGLPDRELVNAQGGAIAIGHPLGASGARILGTLAERLRRTGDRYGVAALCIGVGQGLAIVLENPSVEG